MKADLEKKIFLKGRDRMPAVLIAAAECAPLSKTGGLADVAGALPRALGKLGFDARVITPYHRCMKGKYDGHITHMGEIFVDLGWRHQYAGLEKLELDGNIYYLVDSEFYFGDAIYRGGDSEVEQYAFFQRAVLELLPMLDFTPEILHCNDWHTGLIPLLLKAQYADAPQGRLRTVFSIHNLAFQGWLSPERLEDLMGLEGQWLKQEGAYHLDCCNFLKSGVLYADKVNTVSPSYAEEICTPEFGATLDPVLLGRGEDLSGILNGIDTAVFDPAADGRVPFHYDAARPADKRKNKQKLLESLGLNQNLDTPVIAMVTRMTKQKGFDLVLRSIDAIMARDVTFVLLGTGDGEFEDAMRYNEYRYKGRLCSYIGYSEDVARLIYAGADFFLMPSAFEPCGLSQMIAQRYGTLPIVHAVGGLKDTVRPYNRATGEGDGFVFREYTVGAMLGEIERALAVYGDQQAMARLISNAMGLDVSVEKCAEQYGELYIDLSAPGDSAVIHLPGDPLYRSPIGTVEGGGTLRLRLKAGSFADSVRLWLDGKSYPMVHVGGGLLEAELAVPEKPGVVYYSFELAPGLWFGADGMGQQPMERWPVTVYEKGFRTPDWVEGVVMYQIFPDRFARGGGAFRKGVAYHEKLGREIQVHDNWDEPVKYRGEGGAEYVPNDFYGGTLAGIEEALPDLKRRGFTAIYLNPIFESPSNHRYDTADYSKIDPMLGTRAEFKSLCAKAAELGMRIILDGVFSRTGADSVYFNRDERYKERGACQGPESPYYTWYSFRQFPDDYHCWKEQASLPAVDMNDPGWQDYMVDGRSAVLKKWLKEGAGGWRLDTPDEMSDDLIVRIRQAIKKADPEALIMGELWEGAGVEGEVPRMYALGRGLDSVMNHPLRGALLDFALGKQDAAHLRNVLLWQKVQVPAPMYRCMMNHLGTHDTARLRTVLATGLDGENMTREEQAVCHITWEQQRRGRALQRLLAAVQFAVPGIPCVYYGDEEGMTGFRDPFCRGAYHQAAPEESLRDFYAKLANARQSSEALRRGDAAFANYGPDVLVVLRWVKGEAVLTAVNRSDNTVGIVPRFMDFQGLDGAAAAGLPLLPALEIPPMDYVMVKA